MDYSNDFIAHYGVKGMRWGVIRTEAQLAAARAKNGIKTAIGKIAKKKDSSSKSEKKESTKKKSVSEMSDEELSTVVKRLQLEAQYNKLSPKKERVVDTFIKKVVVDKSIEAASKVAGEIIEDMIRDITKRKKK